MFSWESFYVICTVLIVPSINQHQCMKKHATNQLSDLQWDCPSEYFHFLILCECV